MSAAIPVDEVQRLARLQALSVLDTEAEPLFDALTRAAVLVTGAPIALITLVDAERQWFKSNVGLAGTTETPRASAFCAHTILGPDLLEIADAQRDPRFADNPMVTGEPHIRFYAGAPIELGDGLRMGSLCVIDREPRVLDDMQRDTIRALARATAEALELRRLALARNSELEREAETARARALAATQLEQKLRASEAFLDRTGRLAGVGGWQVDLLTRDVVWSDETCRIHELPVGYRPTLEQALDFYTPEARGVMQAAVEKAMSQGTGWDLELPLVTAAGRKIWVRAIGTVEFSDDGKPLRLLGAVQDVTIRKRVVSTLEASDRRFRKLFQFSLGLICTHDYEGTLLSVNPAAARSLGYSIGELLGRSLMDFIRPERHAAFRDYLLRMVTNDSDEGTLELVAKDGQLRIWQYQNVLDDDGDEPYVLGHAQDITDRHHHEQSLRELSVRDPLTGCFNRRLLTEVSATCEPQLWGCIAIDLDHFKQVNDTYGHQRGDEVLVAMARFLARHVRPADAVVRLGGDEFLVLLRDVEPGLAEGVVARIEHDRADAPIAFTLGWATFGQGVSLEQGLAEADRQLYRKRAARAC